MSHSEPTPYHVHALLLAAGESKRFGAIKQLTLIDKHPLILRTLTQFRAANFDSLSVALGARAQQIAQVLPGDVDILITEHWQQGMGNSIANGVKNLPANTTHLFIGLVDQVEIYAKQCNLLVELSKKQRTKIIASQYHGRRGAPAIFPRTFFSELGTLDSDYGARDLLNNSGEVIPLDLPEAAIDIDTKTELNAYLATLASSQQ